MANVTVPETIVRAIAAAPESHVRNVVLGAMGLLPNLESNTEEERQAAIIDLEQLAGTGAENQLLPFYNG